MKEYIERAAAEQAIHAIMPSMSTLDGAGANDEMVFAAQEMCADALSAVHCLPAADVAEVRHGRWIGLEYDGYADGCPVYDLWECSECGEEVRGEDVPVTHPWCHCCGARMDKEDEHEAD